MLATLEQIKTRKDNKMEKIKQTNTGQAMI